MFVVVRAIANDLTNAFQSVGELGVSVIESGERWMNILAQSIYTVDPNSFAPLISNKSLANAALGNPKLRLFLAENNVSYISTPGFVPEAGDFNIGNYLLGLSRECFPLMA